MAKVKPATRLMAGSADISGSSQRVVQGTGILASQVAAVAGAGNDGDVLTGSGMAASQAAMLASTTIVVRKGAGALLSQPAAVFGSGAGASTYEPTHFVTAAATGSGDGSQGSPWSLSQAMANAVAGNKIQVGPGVFTGSNTTSRSTPAWNPANNGSPGNPIVFFAENPAAYNDSGRSELRSGSTSNGSGCPAFGVGGNNRSYIVWDGFYVNEDNSASRSDTGPVVFFGSNGNPVSNCEMRRCRIDSNAASWNDNHSCVRLEHSTGIRILDCKLNGAYDNNGSGTHSQAVIIYASSEFEIAYNEVWDCHGGIYPKGWATGRYIEAPGSIHHNHIHDCDDDRLILIGGVNRGTGFLDVFQNLLDGGGLARFGFGFLAYSDPAPLDVRIVNNTVVNVTDSANYLKSDSPGGTVYNGCVMQNNIFGARLTGDDSLAAQFDQWGTIDRNLHTNSTVFNSENFSSWQAQGLDVNGQQGAAGFSDPGSGDFRLGGGSIAIDAGLDILNLLGGGTSAPINQGCYITDSDEIGVRANPTY